MEGINTWMSCNIVCKHNVAKLFDGHHLSEQRISTEKDHDSQIDTKCKDIKQIIQQLIECCNMITLIR